MHGKFSRHCLTSLNATKQGWNVAPYFAAPSRRRGMQRVGIGKAFHLFVHVSYLKSHILSLLMVGTSYILTQRPSKVGTCPERKGFSGL
jgi:hypothetical protein